MDEGRAHRYQAESHNQGWQVISSSDDLKEDVGWDLDCDIREVEDGECPVEAVSSKVQILLHSLNPRISATRISFS